MIRNLMKRALAYVPLSDTSHVLNLVEPLRRDGLPICPASEGDFLFSLARKFRGQAVPRNGISHGKHSLVHGVGGVRRRRQRGLHRHGF